MIGVLQGTGRREKDLNAWKAELKRREQVLVLSAHCFLFASQCIFTLLVLCLVYHWQLSVCVTKFYFYMVKMVLKYFT